MALGTRCRSPTPVFDELWEAYPTTTLTACGRAVGLPEGQMGNSEVGHLNLGAGSVVMQDLTRIDAAAADGSLAANEVLRDAFTASERVHVIGLVSDGGVHSSLEHLRALIELAASLQVPDLVVHAFTDGRDTTPKSGAGYLEQVAGWMDESGAGRIGSVIGRYYAMDRDERWDRVQQAYDMLVHGQAEHHADSGAQAARDAYERDETDEFITATLVGDEARIRPGDSVLGLNFRPDRMREITQALADPTFDAFDRGDGAPVERYATMTEYEEGWPYPVAFPPERPETTIAAVIADRGERQLHVAETEKYPHVTYFFNGGEETAYAGEERELVPSPRDVPTYDHKPAMSAPEAAAAFVSAWGTTTTVRDHQFRQRRHGRPHRRDPRRRRGNRDGRPLPGHRGGGRPRQRRGVFHHRRPRQRRSHARARRQPQHGALLEPGAGHRHHRRCLAAWRRGAGRRGAHASGDARHRSARRDVGHLAASALALSGREWRRSRCGVSRPMAVAPASPRRNLRSENLTERHLGFILAPWAVSNALRRYTPWH